MNDISTQSARRPNAFLMLFGFLVVVLGVGMVLGFVSGPDNWYANLAKPSFNPPNQIFAPVWTLLYIMIAVAGWRIWRVAPKSLAMVLWGLQMVLNWLWTPVFFVAHNPELALLIIVALLISIILFIVQARKHDKAATWLFAPYAVWVCFATLLNVALAWLN